jgi:ATP-dependent exoDNAse (exonuclease V) beta subunit
MSIVAIKTIFFIPAKLWFFRETAKNQYLYLPPLNPSRPPQTSGLHAGDDGAPVDESSDFRNKITTFIAMGSVKLLRASAGSGKTWRLAYEYVRAVVNDPSQYAHILAVTFTNKATAEMKRRIVEEINAIARGGATGYMERLQRESGLSADEIRRRAAAARTRILHDYSHFAVLTIDKFFQRVIRSFIRELGIDLKVTLELQTGGLLSAAADAIVDEMTLDAALRRWVVGFVEEKIEEGRRWEVKSELVALGREIFNERYRRRAASAVSKDELKTIVEDASARAAAIISDAQKIAKASLQVVADNGLTLSDFAGGSRSFAYYFAKVAAGDLPEPGAAVLKATENDGAWSSKTSPRRADILAIASRLRADLQQLTDTWQLHHRFLNSVEILRRNYRNFALLTDLAAKTEAICATENILPIAETNNIIHRLVAGNDTPFIFEKVGNHYTRMMIDEFQDTSAMQWENFLPLLENALAQSEDAPVLLVGDVKQSIYRWRGGDWRILSDRIERIFADVEAENLDTNYRSFENIVSFNNEVIARCVESDSAKLDAQLADAQQVGLISTELQRELTGILARAYEGHEQRSVRGLGQGYVTVTEREDLSPVIARIEDLQRRGFGAGDIAILVRTNAEGIEIANALLEYKKQNPTSPYTYDVVTQEALLINSAPVTAFVLACYKLSSDPEDGIQKAVYNRWLGRGFEAPLMENDLETFENLRQLSPVEAFETIVHTYRLGERQNNIAYLQALEDQILTFSRTAIGDVQLFARWWDENGGSLSLDVPDAGAAITVSTIHKSKGLQYRAVIVPWCSWSLVPSSHSVVWADAAEVAEGLGDFPVEFGKRMKNSLMAAEYYKEMVMSHVDAINIFYVAATRAEEELHLMMPADDRRKTDRISMLVLDAVGDRREFGTPTAGTPAGQLSTRNSNRPEGIQAAFASFPIGGRLQLRRLSERYGERVAARDHGVMMHRAFENADDFGDIERAVEAMVEDGILSSDEVAALRGTIAGALANPLVRSWFDGSWEAVRSENRIILPTESGVDGARLRVPDRVMMRGKRAVVVDYKFGLSRSASYRKQIEEYAELLKKMGYNDLSGYIWYVSLGDIERVV